VIGERLLQVIEKAGYTYSKKYTFNLRDWRTAFASVDEDEPQLLPSTLSISVIGERLLQVILEIRVQPLTRTFNLRDWRTAFAS